MVEKKDIALSDIEFADKPIFTGSYTIDTAVSVYEKFAEASKVIYNAILAKKNEKAKTKGERKDI